MTSLHWSILLMIVGCASVVLRFVRNRSGKPIYTTVLAGLSAVYLWVFTKEQEAGEDETSRQGRD